MHIGTHFTAYEMEKDNRRKRFASTHHNHIMVNKNHNSSKKCVKKNKEDLKGYNVIISPEDMHTIKLNHIKYQDLNIINVINSVIIFLCIYLPILLLSMQVCHISVCMPPHTRIVSQQQPKKIKYRQRCSLITYFLQ